MRKTLLIGFVLLLVLLVGGVVVAPGLIDWNKHKAFIAAQVKDATGRDLAINGDIEIAVFPSPALVANDIRLSNLAGGASPEMVLLKSAEVRIAFGPLLTGNVQVEEVRLVEPVIELEVLSDGTANWVFEPQEASAKSAPVPSAQSGGSSDAPAAAGGLDVQLDNFTIENGTLVYRDARSGTIEQVERINARVAMASLAGPFESAGRLAAREIPLSYVVTVGKIIQGRTVPVALTLSAGAGNTTLDVSGTLTGLETSPRFKGKVDLKGDDLAGLARGVAGGAELPGFLAQGFGVRGAMIGSQSEVKLSEVSLSLGDALASGGVDVTLGDAVAVQADLAVSRVDLDSWLSGKVKAAKAAPAVPGTSTPVPPAPIPARTKDAAPFALPTGVSASVRLGIDALTYQGGVIRQFRANAELAEGEVTLSQFSAQMPGNTEFAVFGFLTPKDGKPYFEGEMEASASDFRGALEWLGVDLQGVPKDRLRRFAYKSALRGTPDQLQLIGMNATMDSSKLTGGITAALGRRIGIGADLTLDRINVDAYLPVPVQSQGKTASAAAGGAKTPGAGSATTPAGGGDPLAGLAVLQTFDANLKARVGRVVYNKAPIKNVEIDSTLHNGSLTLRRLHVGQAAGATATVKGALSKLGDVPRMKDLSVDFRAKDLGRVLRLVGAEAPPELSKMGAVALKATGNGPLLKPALDARLSAAGATATLKGQTLLLPTPGFDADLAVKSKDLMRLIRAAGVAYRPSGALGGIDLALHAKGTLDTVTLSGITGNVGPVAVKGDGVVGLAGPRPKVTLSLGTGEIPVDTFLPAQKTAALDRPPFGIAGLVPASMAVPKVSANDDGPTFKRIAVRSGGIDPRWSRDPLDLSALKSLDADVAIKAVALIYQGYRFEDADLVAKLANGVLKAERLTGKLFGGTVDATAMVDGTGVPRINTAVKLQLLDVGHAVQAALGKGIASGKLGLDLNLDTSGGSVAGLVSALGGNGSIGLKDVDVKKGAKGTALAGILDLVLGLNSLGAKKGSLADLTGSFTMQNGVASSRDLALKSGAGNGKGIATVDLPRWHVDASGTVEVAQGLLTQLLIQKTGGPISLPFSVSGRLDGPNVKLDTASLPGKGIAIPGLDKLKKKKGVGAVLDTVLPGLLGGGQPQQQPSTGSTSGDGGMAPPPSKGSQTQQQQKVEPKDLLRGIFNQLGR